MPRKKKFARLLEDADIKRWYDNTARGSRVTADVYLRRLGNFCSHHKITPKKLVEMDQKERYNLLLDFVSMMEKKGYAGSYIQSTFKVVKSWLAHNRIELKGKIEIRGTEDTPMHACSMVASSSASVGCMQPAYYFSVNHKKSSRAI